MSRSISVDKTSFHRVKVGYFPFLHANGGESPVVSKVVRNQDIIVRKDVDIFCPSQQRIGAEAPKGETPKVESPKI